MKFQLYHILRVFDNFTSSYFPSRMGWFIWFWYI